MYFNLTSGEYLGLLQNKHCISHVPLQNTQGITSLHSKGCGRGRQQIWKRRSEVQQDWGASDWTGRSALTAFFTHAPCPHFLPLKSKKENTASCLHTGPGRVVKLLKGFRCGEQVTLFTVVWTSGRRKEWSCVACGRQGCWASAEQNKPASSADSSILFSVLRGTCGGVGVGFALSFALTSIPSSFSIPLCYSRVFEKEHHPAPSNKNLFCLKLSESSSCYSVLERDCTPDAHSFSSIQAFLWSRICPSLSALGCDRQSTGLQ